MLRHTTVYAVLHETLRNYYTYTLKYIFIVLHVIVLVLFFFPSPVFVCISFSFALICLDVHALVLLYFVLSFAFGMKTKSTLLVGGGPYPSALFWVALKAMASGEGAVVGNGDC